MEQQAESAVFMEQCTYHGFNLYRKLSDCLHYILCLSVGIKSSRLVFTLERQWKNWTTTNVKENMMMITI